MTILITINMHLAGAYRRQTGHLILNAPGVGLRAIAISLTGPRVIRRFEIHKRLGSPTISIIILGQIALLGKE